MRKMVVAVAALVASAGFVGFAPTAFAGPDPEETTTTESAGYPPEATTTTVAATTTTESESGPATLEPDPSTDPAVIEADLPSTGGGVAPLQIGAGLIVVGLLVIVLVRRRRATPTPAG